LDLSIGGPQAVWAAESHMDNVAAAAKRSWIEWMPSTHGSVHFRWSCMSKPSQRLRSPKRGCVHNTPVRSREAPLPSRMPSTTLARKHRPVVAHHHASGAAARRHSDLWTSGRGASRPTARAGGRCPLGRSPAGEWPI